MFCVLTTAFANVRFYSKLKSKTKMKSASDFNLKAKVAVKQQSKHSYKWYYMK